MYSHCNLHSIKLQICRLKKKKKPFRNCNQGTWNLVSCTVSGESALAQRASDSLKRSNKYTFLKLNYTFVVTLNESLWRIPLGDW